MIELRIVVSPLERRLINRLHLLRRSRGGKGAMDLKIISELRAQPQTGFKNAA
jgi:hypothetical protein